MCLVCQCQKEGRCANGTCDGFHYAQDFTEKYYKGLVPLEVAIKAIAHHENWSAEQAEQYIKEDPYAASKTV